MGLRAEFALHHSGHEDFLFAPLWQEENGSVLSVLSALARLGMDPWKEAAVLASKPKKDAAASLAAILARLPTTFAEPPSYWEFAERLVKLLPDEAVERAAEADGSGRRRFLAIDARLIIVLAAMLAVVLGQWLI